MRKILFVALIFVLTACVTGPTRPGEAPTQAPVSQDTLEPSATPAPTDAPATATEAATATSAPEATATEPAASSAQNSFGDISFENKAGETVSGTGDYSVTAFAAKCDTVADHVTLTIQVNDAKIYKVNYAYRMTAVDTPLITSGWSGDTKMDALGDGKFQVDFPASQVPSKARTWKAWLDLQFIAFDSQDVTYSSQALTKLITYTYKCP